MWEDTLVEEVHAIREQLLARFDGDLHRYCEYVRSQSALPMADTAAAAAVAVVPIPATVVGARPG